MMILLGIILVSNTIAIVLIILIILIILIVLTILTSSSSSYSSSDYYNPLNPKIPTKLPSFSARALAGTGGSLAFRAPARLWETPSV